MSKIITQPEIPEIFAVEGDTRTIPVSTTTSGAASYNKGFPIETSLPKENGGVPPSRLDFNGILSVLSSFAYYLQSGGCFSWQDDRDYLANFEVIGSDDLRYHCIQENGVNYGGPQDPISSPEFWRRSSPIWRELYYLGNGTQTDFECPETYYISEVNVFIDGILQKKGDSYELINPGATALVRFSEAVPVGRTITLQIVN